MIFLLEIMWLEEYLQNLHVAYESNCNLKRRVEVPWVFDFLDLLDRASQHDAQLFRRSSLSSQSTSPSSIRHPFPCPATTYQHQTIPALSVIPPIDIFSFISLIAVFPSVMFRSGLSLNGTGRIHGHQRDGRCGTNRGTDSPRSPSKESSLVPLPRRPPVDLLFHAERALLSLQFHQE